MRGQQAITAIFPKAIEPKPEQKGHRNVHIDRRDDLLAARFYYYFHLKRWRYDDILSHMEYNEVFITTLVIAQRLTLRADYMKNLLEQNTSTNDLKKMFPAFAWN